MKTIKIGGHNFKIEFDKSMILESDDVGRCCANTNKIYLNPDIPLSNKEETLLHEVIEAINQLYELKLEHHQIQTIGASLHQIGRDNEIIDLGKYLK